MRQGIPFAPEAEREQRLGTHLARYDSRAAEAVLDRMATECAARLASVERPLVVGLPRRAAPQGRLIAARLAARLRRTDIEAPEVRVLRDADDPALRNPTR